MLRNEVDVHRLSLIVLRLMDGDLILPQQGRALISEIEAFEHALNEANTQSVTANSEQFLSILEALVQADRLDAMTPIQAEEIVHRILHGSSDPVDLPRA